MRSLLFHNLVSRYMSSLTFAFGSNKLIGDWTLHVVWIGNHLSSQIPIVFPSPTLHIRPFLTRSIESLRSLQMRKGLWPDLAFKTLVEGKYFVFRICPTKEFGFFTILQTFLAKSALLIATRSRKPNPPLDLTLLMTSTSSNRSSYLYVLTKALL